MSATTSTLILTHRIQAPCEMSEFTPEQQARVNEFRDDIKRARANNREGYGFHLWVGGRLHDSALTHHDAFLEGEAIRKGGNHEQIVIGQGGGYSVTNDGKIGGAEVFFYV